MVTNFDRKIINEKIDEKEKQYIQIIAEKVSKETVEMIEEEAEDFFENMDSASSKVQSLSLSLSELDTMVEKLKSFDFFKQAESITIAEEKLSKSIGETQKVFDAYAEKNIQFQSNMEKNIESWKIINKDLSNETSAIKENCKIFKENIVSMNKLINDVNVTVENLNRQLEKSSTEKLETQIVEIKRENKEVSMQLLKIAKSVPASMISIGIGVVIVILQIISIIIA